MHVPCSPAARPAGIVLMQLAVPSLRKVSELRNFRQSLARNNNELHVGGVEWSAVQHRWAQRASCRAGHWAGQGVCMGREPRGVIGAEQ